MSSDILIGMPRRRIIRSRELATYLRSEDGARSATAERLPAPLPEVVAKIQAAWPAAAYRYGKTSVTTSVGAAEAPRARAFLNQLAAEQGLLFHDSESGLWLDARQPDGAVNLRGFTSERGVMSFVSKGDAALLLDAGWFEPGRFFCFTSGEGHFLQLCNRDGEFCAEFRAGPGKVVHRAHLRGATQARRLLEGYLGGENMNTPEFGFEMLQSAAEDAGYPVRGPDGRWIPPPPKQQ